MNHWPYPYKTLDGLGPFGVTGTVTSVSASVPSWLSVTVTNPTTTPNIVITGSATGSGITVLQDAPTLLNTVTFTGRIDIPRNSGNGLALDITNAHAGVQDNYIAIGKNSSARNHVHVGHHFVASGDPGNYAYIQTHSAMIKFTGDANFIFPLTTGSNGQALITDGAGNTSWSTLTTGTVTSVSASVPSFLSVTVTNPTSTPSITIGYSGTALPITSGGTGLTSVGSNNQVLTSNGTSLFWSTPTTGTVTSVSGSSPINSSGGANPTISLSTVPTTLGGTGLTTVGSNGQVLTSNGSSLFYSTPTVGTVTNFSATITPIWTSSFISATVTNSTTTPALNIDFTNVTGNNALVLSDRPIFENWITVSGTGIGPVLGRFGDTNATPGSFLEIILGKDVTSIFDSGKIQFYYEGANDSFICFSHRNKRLRWYGAQSAGALLSSTAELTIDSPTSIRFTVQKTNPSPPPTTLTRTLLFTGDADFTFPTSTGTNGYPLLTNGSGVTSWSTLGTNAGGTGLTTVGSNGQVLTSNGTSLTWTTPTTGTVTSVAATSPLASSGGATPTISIASSTGTGSVVLNTDPELQTTFNLKAPVVGQGYLRVVSVNNTNYIQTALANVSGSIADLVIGSHFDTARLMVLKASGNVGIGTSTPSARLSVAGEGRILELDGSTQSYLDFDISSTLGLQMGFIYTGDPSFYITQKRNGPIEFYHDGTSGKVTNFYMPVTTRDYLHISKPGTGVNTEINILSGSVGSPSVANTSTINFGTVGGGGGTVFNTLQMKYAVAYGYHLLATADTFVTSGPIALNSTVTLKIAPASTTFDFILPSGPGTAGQYLISGGAGAAMYWGSGGGGGGGSVNSVTASAPLASSGGTAPNISIASATGTGAVVLNADPEFQTAAYVKAPVAGQGFLRFVSVANSNYIQSGLANTGGSSADLIFGTVNDTRQDLVIKNTGNIGIGTLGPTSKLHIIAADLADTVRVQNINAAGYASINFTTPTREFVVGAAGATATAFSGALQNKAYFIYNGQLSGVIDSSNRWGIRTTNPSTVLDINGDLRVGTDATVLGNLEAPFYRTPGYQNINYFSSFSGLAQLGIFFLGDSKFYRATTPPGRTFPNFTYTTQGLQIVRWGAMVTVVAEIKYSYTVGLLPNYNDCRIALRLGGGSVRPRTYLSCGYAGYPTVVNATNGLNRQVDFIVTTVTNNDNGNLEGIILLYEHGTVNSLQYVTTDQVNQSLNLTITYISNVDSGP